MWATGNFHVCFLIDPDDATEMAEARRLNGRMIDRALAMGGTCTGEHGIGCGKLDYLEVGARRRGRRSDALDQAHAGPPQPDEPRQGGRRLSAPPRAENARQ